MLTILSTLFEHGSLRRREILTLSLVCKTLYNAKNAAVYHGQTRMYMTGPPSDPITHTERLACGRIHGLAVREGRNTYDRDMYNFGQHVAYQHVRHYGNVVNVIECDLRTQTYRLRSYKTVGGVSAESTWCVPLKLQHNDFTVKNHDRYQLVGRATYSANEVYYSTSDHDSNPRNLLRSFMHAGGISDVYREQLDRDYEENLTIKLLGD